VVKDLRNGHLAILDYARQKHFAIDRFIEVRASSRKNRGQRRIEELLGSLAAGDRLVVSELSRLGRSLGQVIQIVDELVTQKTHLDPPKRGWWTRFREARRDCSCFRNIDRSSF